MNPRLAVNLLSDRIAALPLAIVYVTDRCNSKCATCDFWRYGQTNLPVERARSLAGEFRRMGTQVVLLTGGEALLHPHWDEVAAAFRAEGQRLWLLTAGLSLKKHAARAVELCERITVSLDGATPGTYESIRGVPAFEAVCSGIRAAGERGAWVSLRCTIQRGNYREMPALIRLAQDLGVKQVSFLSVDVSTHVAFARHEDFERTMALAPGDIAEFDRVLDSVERDFWPEFASGFIAESPAKLRRLRQYFAALLGQADFPPVRCNAPRFSAVVGADGSLQPCYFISGVSRLNGGALETALNTPEAVALRRDIREGRRRECATCVCSMWRGPSGLLLQDF